MSSYLTAKFTNCSMARIFWSWSISSKAGPDGFAGLGKHFCTYKATIAYDGTSYKGFQLQNPPHKSRITIQGEIEACLTTMFSMDRRALTVQGAGRTDSGVHARGQVRDDRVRLAFLPFKVP